MKIRRENEGENTVEKKSFFLGGKTFEILLRKPQFLRSLHIYSNNLTFIQRF